MTKNINYVSHKKSKLKTNDGKPQLPSPSALVEGEIAINYAEDVETLSIKNESGNVVTFSSDNYYTEQKLGSAFTDNDVTVTDVTNSINDVANAAAVGVLSLKESKTDLSAFTEHTASTVHMTETEKTNLDSLATNIVAISGITANDINAWNAAAGIDLTQYYKKTETSGATELSTAFDNKADSSDLTSLSGTVTAHTANADIHVTSADKTAWNAKADLSDIPSVSGYADAVKYNNTTHYVEFYHGTTAGTKVFEYDASPFIIDGMVQNVEIKDVTSGETQVTCLVISFNTDAGKQDINIPISQIFDASNYYTTAQTDTKITEATSGKVDNATYTAYTADTATEIGSKLATSDFNTYSGAVDTLIGEKASQTSVNALNDVVTAHTASTDIHVTAADKTKWNNVDNKLNTSDFNTYSGNVDTAISNKVDKVEGKGLSTNDFTNELKTKLDGIAEGAEVNVQANWTENDTASDSYIQNKPTLGTAAAKGVSTGITNSDNLIEAKHIYSGVGVTVAYDSENHYIQLKNTAGSVLSSFDASAFLVDGMVDSVTLETKSGSTYLVITWNTVAGKTATELNIGDIFDADNYLTKEQLTASTNYVTVTKANSANTASTVDLTGVTNADDLKAIEALTGTSGLLKKTAANTWGLDTTSYSSATQVNTALASKSDTGHTHDDRYYTETEIDNKIEALSGSSTGSTSKTITSITESNGVVTANYADISITKSQVSDFPTIPTVNDGTFTISGNGASVVSTSANASANNGVNIKQGTNITITTASSEISIAATDTKYANGNFITITGSNNSINVTTGTTSSSVARGDHSHDSVYTKITDSKEMEETLAAAITDVNSRAADKEELKALVNDYQDFKLMYENRRERKRFTNRDDFFANLRRAAADQNLERYGLKVGDYLSHNGHDYVIAGLNTMRGTRVDYRVTTDHIGLIVIPHTTQAWNVSGNTYQSTHTYSTGGTWSDGAGAGYANSDLHHYMTETLLPIVNTDLGSSYSGGVLTHYKLYSNAVNTNGYNRYGSAGGCSSSWSWYANQKICALSEVQVYGSIVWSSSGYDTGEACRQLDVFRVYNMNEIFGNEYPWLRDVASASYACYVGCYGGAYYDTASHAFYVAALILFA